MIQVVGSLALDTVKTPFGVKQKVLGGSASYFSVAASLMAPVGIIGVVGKDFPEKYINYFKKTNIDTSGIEYSQEATFHWSGHYEAQMDIAHTDETQLGAFASFNPTLTEKQSQSEFLFLGNIDPKIQKKVFDQIKKPVFAGLDSMDYWIRSQPQYLQKIIQKVDVLFLNDLEARQFAKEAGLIKAAKKIQAMGPGLLIVKLGEYGILVVSEKFMFRTCAYPTQEVKDPTGAGDSFAGGFISYMYSNFVDDPKNLQNEEIIKQATIWGAGIASFAIEDFSTTGLDRVSKKEVWERCREIHKITQFGDPFFPIFP